MNGVERKDTVETFELSLVRGDILYRLQRRIGLIPPDGPGIGRRAIPGQVGSLVDLMPTLLELAGGEPPAHAHGQSLAPVLRGERDRLEQAHAFFETAGGAGVRSPTHTYYLAWAGQERCLEDQTRYFYDDARDPYQLRNLAGTGEQRDASARLDSALREWDRATPWMETGV